MFTRHDRATLDEVKAGVDSLHADQRVVGVLVSRLRHQRRRLSAALACMPVEHPLPALEIMNMDLQPLIDEMNKTSTVIDGAIVFVQGVPKLIADAVEKAVANGATAEQLKPVTDLGQTLDTKAQALADAMAAGTGTSPPNVAATKKK